MTQAEAQKARAVRNERRRADEVACAYDFLIRGDELGVHAKRCVFGAHDACAREYDPWPDAFATPDSRMYEGTGIGALYGFGTTKVSTLAGWNVRRRKRRST